MNKQHKHVKKRVVNQLQQKTTKRISFAFEKQHFV